MNMIILYASTLWILSIAIIAFYFCFGLNFIFGALLGLAIYRIVWVISEQLKNVRREI